ncbi:phage tail assembly chaperone G [Alkalicoccus luteus]|uniref:Phage protein n=1 Tax=Alkalicoccus luteus TaxID=1237094 RepID=A0A969TT22_9BACI|nr:hypothetical protein [Alkalicoccus luteus]NJP37193.1 hypothetical protein [Alkalicoccus luteus]
MKIELTLNGEKKFFTVPFVPMITRRKYLEFQAKQNNQPEDKLTPQDHIDEMDEMYSLLPNVVFKGQFTLDDLYEGASKTYIEDKLIEAVYGIKPKSELDENEEGNAPGE